MCTRPAHHACLSWIYREHVAKCHPHHSLGDSRSIKRLWWKLLDFRRQWSKARNSLQCLHKPDTPLRHLRGNWPWLGIGWVGQTEINFIQCFIFDRDSERDLEERDSSTARVFTGDCIYAFISKLRLILAPEITYTETIRCATLCTGDLIYSQ